MPISQHYILYYRKTTLSTDVSTSLWLDVYDKILSKQTNEAYWYLRRTYWFKTKDSFSFVIELKHIYI
jgi:ligand-binding sensor domain-containing protein